MHEHDFADIEQESDSTNEISRRGFLQRAALTAGGAAVGASLLGEGLVQASTTLSPRRGGTLRVGMVGGGAAETLNPTRQLQEIDIARAHTLFERLVDLKPNGKLYYQLAEGFSPNRDASVWKIKVRPHIQWHDGSNFTAQDVAYTFKYLLDPANKAVAGNSLKASMAPSGVRVLDPTTVEIRLLHPDATLPTILSSRDIYIIKHGTTTFDHPIGTGPFKFQAWTPGERSRFVRNGHYRLHNGPYLAALEFLSINDPSAQLNALLAGQIEAVAQLGISLVPTAKASHKVRVLVKGSGSLDGFAMRTNEAPFTDKRVRQAFRLMVNREQMLKNALGGFGVIGNDLHSNIDPDYAKTIPQRKYDPEQAKHLLKAAGHQNLTVTLPTADAAPGMLNSSTLFAAQAARAGVNVNLDKVGADEFWNTRFLNPSYPLDTTNWGYRPLVTMFNDAYLPTSPINETVYNNSKFNRLFAEARRTVNHKKRHEILVEMQKMLWDDGGYIIWGFLSNVDAISTKVHGLVPSAVRWLGWYTFTDVYLA